MKKETFLLIIVAVAVAGFVWLMASKGSKEKSPATVQPATSQPAPVYNQRVSLLEQIVSREPANRGAWIELGNQYYDLGQPAKAIEAYDKALALQPDDPNVLTDQGVMFRQLRMFDRAAENFAKANEINPAHHQSLYNLGIVYRYDLNDLPKAVEAWKRYLAIQPPPPGADQVRAELEAMQSLQQGFNK